MHCTVRLAIAVLTVLALAPAGAQEVVQSPPPRGGIHPSHLHHQAHSCLDQKERQAANESGKIIHLAAAMRVAKKRMPGTLVRARLCHGKDGLVYVLTILARDGKVGRLTVDAVKGTLIGKR